MKKFETIKEFLATQSVAIPMVDFLINLILAALVAFVLNLIYVRCGMSLSNRKMFGRNFVLIGMTTMLIIAIVKSSLALSLGLVGALSIVRFRAAIKEPEELAYLFLTIGTGLGFGAGQRTITVAAIGVICGIILIRHRFQKSQQYENLILTISSHKPEKAKLSDILQILKQHCTAAELKRIDESTEVIEASFLVEFKNVEQFIAAKDELHLLGDSVRVAFIDNKGLI